MTKNKKGLSETIITKNHGGAQAPDVQAFPRVMTGWRLIYGESK